MSQEPEHAQETLEVSPNARAAIERLATESADGRETGGILLGRGPDSAGLVCVEIAGDAGPNAKRHRAFFSRDLAHARALARSAWDQSRAVWVGEWHTHTFGPPEPSQRDLATYAHLLEAPQLEFQVFVSIIVAAGSHNNWDDPVPHSWLIAREADRLVVRSNE